ncbi:trna 2 -phosphotransferase 1 protein [Apiospora arundinis]
MTEITQVYPEIPPVFQRSHASCRRLVHLIPDGLAEAVPDHPLFSFPRSTSPRDGFIDISARCFAGAVNKASWFLSEKLGKPTNFESVGYYGPSDLRYFILMLSAIKVGYKMVFTSPRNNLEGHLNVLEKTDCTVMLLAGGVLDRVQPILAKRPMRTLTIPDLGTFLDGSAVEPYPYTKTFEQARNDPCVVLHTTGSTGLPKPVVWKNAMLSTYEAWRTIPAVDGYVTPPEVYQTARRVYTSLPMFHTSGLNAAIIWALSLGVTLVFGAAHVLPNAEYVDEIHRFADVEGSMNAPSIYEDLCAQPKMRVHMRHLYYVVASGAPLSRTAGDQISKYSRVIGNIGATETACLPRLCPSVSDWQYFYWHPTHSGIEMRESIDDLYELVIVRDGKLEPLQGVFYAYPELEEWPMNDLYDRHPTKPFLWRYRGRKDHVIVFSNGEKVVPVLMEAALTSSPLVKGAMVVGHGRFQPLALVELAHQSPPSNKWERRHLIRELSSFIDEANAYAPAHAQLDHHHILFTDLTRPIHYLGQGKIQRHATYELYEDDIAAAYEMIEKGGDLNRRIFKSIDDCVSWLKIQLVGIYGKEVEADDDLFKAGVDSLHVMRLSREIGGIPPSVIYRHPTLRLLASFLVNQAPGDDSDQPESPDALEQMESLLRLYTADLPQRDPKETATAEKSPVQEGEMHIILTGSTGSLGSYLLETLYHKPEVSSIVCLNRGADAAFRQQKIAESRGLITEWDEDRVLFLHADMSAPGLGLEPTAYESLRAKTTHVIHNQWPVNFHWAVTSFQPHIWGVRNLVDLCLSSHHDPILFFVSSVSAVGAWPAPDPVPEGPVRDLADATMGYGQAKLVSEHILERAVAVSGLRAAVCRIGVVAGPVERSEGLWNRHEYIPALINSSAYIGLLPENFPGRDIVDWLPVDKVATILFEILDSVTKSAPKSIDSPLPVFHVLNPQHVVWVSIVEYICNNVALPKATFDAWLQQLEDSSRECLPDVEKNPAAKLIEFYKSISERKSQPRLDTTKAESASVTLRTTGPVNTSWIAHWMRQWGLAEGELIVK